MTGHHELAEYERPVMMNEKEKNIRECLDRLILAVRESDEYARYEAAKRRIEGCVEEKAAVDEFRRKAYLLSNYTQSDELAEEMKLLVQERIKVRRDPVVAQYLTTEMEFCRLLQSICGEVLSITDLQIDDFIDSIEV